MDPVDNDRYLIQLEALLKRVHSEFYALYDQWLHDKNRLMPDLKQILPDFRRRVLQNVSLCFSHLMPQGYPLEKHRGTIISRAMGATVTADLQIDDQGRCLTTHVVAGKRTSKVERALRYNIHVVTPEWLIDCYEQWERKDEVIYPLTIDYDVKKSRLFTRETPRYGKKQKTFLSFFKFSLQRITKQMLIIDQNHRLNRRTIVHKRQTAMKQQRQSQIIVSALASTSWTI